MKTTKDLLKLVNFCKKHGVLRLKTEDVEIELTEKVVGEQAPRRKKQTDTRPIIQVTEEVAERMPTDDEMLFWSTEHFDQLTEQRKA